MPPAMECHDANIQLCADFMLRPTLLFQVIRLREGLNDFFRTVMLHFAALLRKNPSVVNALIEKWLLLTLLLNKWRYRRG